MDIRNWSYRTLFDIQKFFCFHYYSQICAISEAAIFRKNDEQSVAQRSYDGFKDKTRDKYNDFLTQSNGKLHRIRIFVLETEIDQNNVGIL